MEISINDYSEVVIQFFENPSVRKDVRFVCRHLESFPSKQVESTKIDVFFAMWKHKEILKEDKHTEFWFLYPYKIYFLAGSRG